MAGSELVITDASLAKGLNIVNGKVVYKEISDAFNLENLKL